MCTLRDFNDADLLVASCCVLNMPPVPLRIVEVVEGCRRCRAAACGKHEGGSLLEPGHWQLTPHRQCVCPQHELLAVQCFRVAGSGRPAAKADGMNCDRLLTVAAEVAGRWAPDTAAHRDEIDAGASAGHRLHMPRRLAERAIADSALASGKPVRHDICLALCTALLCAASVALCVKHLNIKLPQPASFPLPYSLAVRPRFRSPADIQIDSGLWRPLNGDGAWHGAAVTSTFVGAPQCTGDTSSGLLIGRWTTLWTWQQKRCLAYARTRRHRTQSRQRRNRSRRGPQQLWR